MLEWCRKPVSFRLQHFPLVTVVVHPGGEVDNSNPGSAAGSPADANHASMRNAAIAAARANMKSPSEMTDDDRTAMRRTLNEINQKFPNPPATVQHAVDHIDHIVSVAGINHVGIGCDFDGGGGIEGVFDASEVMNITIELVRRGYSEEEIGKIWSGNVLRVFREVQALAEQKATKAAA